MPAGLQTKQGRGFETSGRRLKRFETFETRKPLNSLGKVLKTVLADLKNQLAACGERLEDLRVSL